MKKKNCLKLEINPAVIKEVGLTSDDIKKFNKVIASCQLTVKRIKKIGYPIESMQIRGKNGEIAYIRDDSTFEHENKWTLVVELPLSLISDKKSDPRADFVRQAFKFFKPFLNSDVEIASNGKGFKRINTKPYHSFDFTDTKRGDFKMRFKKYSESAPYGSKSGLIDSIKGRNQEMKKEFLFYRNQGDTIAKCLYQVKMWLKKQTIWNGRKGYKELSSKTILRICYSQSM